MPCWCKGQCPHIGEPQKLAKEKQFPAAKRALHRALVIAPMCVEANLALGTLLTNENNAAFAELHFRRAIETAGGEPRLLIGLANNLRSQVRVPEAIAAFRAAIDAVAGVHAYNGLAGSLEQAGDYAEANKVLAEGGLKFPANALLRRTGAVVAASQNDFQGAIAMLSPAAGAPLPIELLDRGRYKEKGGDYAGAWADWMQAKTFFREKQGQVYNVQRFRENFDHLHEIAAPGRRKYYQAAPPLERGPAPLFVTGFPRSGTTMLETVFSSHSKILGGDELIGIPDVITTLPNWTATPLAYPQVLAATSLGDNAAVPALLRDLYYRKAVARIEANIGGKIPKPVKFFTDKMPLNELHWPLIRLLFGNAAPLRVIRRHPLDVLVSCMSHHMPHGGFYASTPESCALHYAGATAVFRHYQKYIPQTDDCMTVRYEDFVRDQEAQTRRILPAICQLEAACLEFHKNPRHARTISYNQVKQPLNDKSIGRYKNFLPMLEPVLPILAETIKAEGYEI